MSTRQNKKIDSFFKKLIMFYKNFKNYRRCMNGKRVDKSQIKITKIIKYEWKRKTIIKFYCFTIK